MPIGTRKLIKLVDETPTVADGEQVPSEVEILNTWADVRLVNSNRSVNNNQTNINKLFEFRFRFRGTITLNVNVKVEYRSVRYTIQSLEREKEKNFYWIIRVEAKSFD